MEAAHEVFIAMDYSLSFILTAFSLFLGLNPDHETNVDAVVNIFM